MNAETSFGSQQLRMFRRLRRDGLSIEDAAERSGCEIETARLFAVSDDKTPPPPGAYELLYEPDALAAASNPKENEMARSARLSEDPEAGEGGGISGEYKRPDAARALKIFTDEISPKQAHMATIKGDLSDPYKRIKDECHFPRKVLDFLMQLEDMEEAKRDHWLLAFRLGCNELELFVPRDLVTMAQGEDGDEVIPTGDRNPSDDLATLAEDDDEDEHFEMSDEERARQANRPSVEAAKAEADAERETPAGTGAAAIAAMNAEAKASAPKARRTARPKTGPDLSVVH